MNDQSADLSKAVACERCRRIPRDQDDLAGWELIDDKLGCPGCFTLLEADVQRREAE